MSKYVFSLNEGEKVNIPYLQEFINNKWLKDNPVFGANNEQVIIVKAEKSDKQDLYLAIRPANYPDNSLTTAVITRVEKQDNGQIMIQAVHESKAPNLSGASKEFIAALGVSTDPNVLQWRNNCLDNEMKINRRKPNAGEVFFMSEGVQTAEGDVSHYFVAGDSRSKIYQGDKGLARITPEELYSRAEVMVTNNLDNLSAKAAVDTIKNSDIDMIVEVSYRKHQIAMALKADDHYPNPSDRVIGVSSSPAVIQAMKDLIAIKKLQAKTDAIGKSSPSITPSKHAM